ncbi:phosphopantetheine-binding protein [Kitasatospora azatica]|uniref:phosphopantetheine-binding protein n=1 Tax=Kitasatospora azatica TaxID=58347 RepID=UPI000559EF59|nr:phosphopantetheine-binding protein [Kitasatospora azatica]
MYDTLISLLFRLGVDTSDVTPESTLRDLDMDSLSITELAVNAYTETGVLAHGMTLDTTLAQVARQLAAVEPQEA